MGRLTPAAGVNPLRGPIVHLDVTGSTNDLARELAAGGAPHGTVVIADEQTAGRGRQGRSWTAPPGLSLTISIVVRPSADALALLPLTAAVAVCRACERVAPGRAAVKWPNDVWIDGRKAAGILVEARPQEGWAALGIGLNVDTTEDDLPSDLRDTATSLRIATGAESGREPALAAVLEELSEWLDAGHDRLLSAYRTRDALAGRAITWVSGDRSLAGEASGIDDDGKLVVFTADGERHALAAGEVHLGG